MFRDAFLQFLLQIPTTMLILAQRWDFTLQILQGSAREAIDWKYQSRKSVSQKKQKRYYIHDPYHHVCALDHVNHSSCHQRHQNEADLDRSGIRYDDTKPSIRQ